MTKARVGILTAALVLALAAGLQVQAGTQHRMAAAPPAVQAPLHPDVVTKISAARMATAKYVSDLERAKADGYMIITPMIPNMGYHFLNPKVEGFDVTKPPILVYVRKGGAWQLVAIEWVFPQRPAAPPLQGAQYGSFGAACHYKDGSFVEASAEARCARRNARTGSEFNFWHGPLVTLHFWIWYPNPNGIFGEFNPLLTPFNNE
jgi:hypothetical protein